MKKFTKVVSLMLAAILMMALCTACGGDSKKDDSTITFGTNAEFPPFEYVTAKGVIGEFDGIDMAIAKQIGEDNGMEAKIENMEFDSLLLALENGQVDAVIAGMTITDEKKDAVDFSKPYYTAKQVMIVKEDSDIQKASDMADKKIVVLPVKLVSMKWDTSTNRSRRVQKPSWNWSMASVTWLLSTLQPLKSMSRTMKV